jgi:hypothetical protein
MTMIISGSDGLEFPDGSDQGTAFTGNAATITSGTIATARLATGTANSSTYLRGDQTWAAVPAATPGGSTTQVQYNNAGAFGGSANFVWDNSNARLGVGISNPAQTVDVQSASGGTTLRLRNTAGNFIDFIETSGSTRQGYIGTTNGTNFVIHNDKAGQMQFDTNNLERMRIDSSGNVGIGTSSPGASYKLDVTGNTRTTGYCSINDIGYIRSSTGLLEFQGGSTATRFMNSGYGAELMRVTQAGDVGIGTDTPTQKLSVVGNIILPTGANRFITIGSGTNYSYDVMTVSDDFQIREAGNDSKIRLRIKYSGTASLAGQLQLPIEGSSTLYNAYTCRAWVNFNPSSSAAVRASGGISSVTDNGSGNYTMNFNFTMPDTNYAASGMARNNDNNNDTCIVQMQLSSTKTTTAFQFSPRENSGGFTATSEVNVMVFR